MGFYEFFTQVYGERWPQLLQALRAPEKKVARLNPFAQNDLTNAKQILGQYYLEDQARTNDERFYFLDLASMLPPIALQPTQEDLCLDMCAAPGGKSLMLAQLTKKLIVNEISQDRRSRLIRVLKEQLPEELFRQIKITAHDASKWCLYQPNHFDKILLDAPCSGERFIINDEKEIAAWTKKKTQSMAMRQFSLIASAFECLKPGGELVYSTCSISPSENDEVIAKLQKKRKDRIEVQRFDSPAGEPTEYGWQILPDKTSYGPIYFAKIKKT